MVNRSINTFNIKTKLFGWLFVKYNRYVIMNRIYRNIFVGAIMTILLSTSCNKTPSYYLEPYKIVSMESITSEKNVINAITTLRPDSSGSVFYDAYQAEDYIIIYFDKNKNVMQSISISRGNIVYYYNITNYKMNKSIYFNGRKYLHIESGQFGPFTPRM